MRHLQFLLILIALVAVTLSLASLALAATPLTISNLRCEYKSNPVGIDIPQPRLSWELVSSERGTLQTATKSAWPLRRKSD